MHLLFDIVLLGWMNMFKSPSTPKKKYFKKIGTETEEDVLEMTIFEDMRRHDFPEHHKEPSEHININDIKW